MTCEEFKTLCLSKFPWEISVAEAAVAHKHALNCPACVDWVQDNGKPSTDEDIASEALHIEAGRAHLQKCMQDPEFVEVAFSKEKK